MLTYAGRDHPALLPGLVLSRGAASSAATIALQSVTQMTGRRWVHLYRDQWDVCCWQGQRGAGRGHDGDDARRHLPHALLRAEGAHPMMRCGK